MEAERDSDRDVHVVPVDPSEVKQIRKRHPEVLCASLS